MASSPVSASCMLCSKPVDLQKEFQTDENGRVVHEDCYVNNVTRKRPDRGLQMLGKVASPLALLCLENARSRLRSLAHGRR
jgi:hypothetical protein